MSSLDSILSYEGGTNDIGQNHGFGEIVYSSQDSYTGYWNDGLQNGLGVYAWDEHRSFSVGNHINGHIEGNGVEFIKGYYLYIGKFEKGKQTGEGVNYFINGYSDNRN